MTLADGFNFYILVVRGPKGEKEWGVCARTETDATSALFFSLLPGEDPVDYEVEWKMLTQEELDDLHEKSLAAIRRSEDE